jgi:hypothetical protein
MRVRGPGRCAASGAGEAPAIKAAAAGRIEEFVSRRRNGRHRNGRNAGQRENNKILTNMLV